MPTKLKNRLFDSLKATSDATGVSREILLFARESGCQAFKGKSRVREGELRDWLKENAELVHNRPKGSREKIWDETWRKLKIANDAKEKVLILKATHDAIISHQAREAQTRLFKIPAELAPKLAGKSAVEINTMLFESINRAIADIGNNETAEIKL